MKTAKLLAVAAAVAGLASFPLMAQQVNASAQQSASVSSAGRQANQSADAGANAGANHGQANANGGATGSLAAEGRQGSANASGQAAWQAQMRPVTGELEGKLDSKTAKVGEPVVLRTTHKLKTADGFVIPKGSRLIGHVTEVQAHAKGHEQSSIAIDFGRAELGNGQSFAIHSVIDSVGPSAAELEADSMANEDAFSGPAGGAMASGGRAMGGGVAVGRAGGGLLGGAGVVGGATSTGGGLDSSVASSAGGALNAGDNAIGAPGSVAEDAAANVGRGISGSTGVAGSLGAHATSIPGVMLDSNATGDASGTFTAARRDVHFNSGTQMVVDMAAAR